MYLFVVSWVNQQTKFGVNTVVKLYRATSISHGSKHLQANRRVARNMKKFHLFPRKKSHLAVLMLSSYAFRIYL